jgi:[ribosomal protein S5]-alanine N-acetyltransferase
MLSPPEIITTPRLQLRRPKMTDASAIFANYAQDEQVTRHLTWKPHKSIEDTKAYLQYCVDGWAQCKAFPWVIIRKEDETLIGAIEFTIAEHKAELGYVLAQNAWGQGFMLEAAKPALQWFQAQDTIYRIWAVCKLENKASVRVLEKLGMQPEGILHRWNKQNISKEPVDCYCYSWWK